MKSRRLLFFVSFPTIVLIFGVPGIVFTLWAIAGDMFDFIRGRCDTPIPLYSYRIAYNPPLEFIEWWYEWCRK